MKRFFFLLFTAFAAFGDCLRGRALAFNAVLTPNETSRGTQSLDADASISIAFSNAIVVHGADDRHFNLPDATNGATQIPIGILLNDQLNADEPGVVKKSIAIFGLYPESLPAVAAAAIAVDAEIVVDIATPGRVKTLPSATGTYYVVGRSRFTVAAAGDPVSIQHCVPRKVVNP